MRAATARRSPGTATGSPSRATGTSSDRNADLSLEVFLWDVPDPDDHAADARRWTRTEFGEADDHARRTVGLHRESEDRGRHRRRRARDRLSPCDVVRGEPSSRTRPGRSWVFTGSDVIDRSPSGLSLYRAELGVAPKIQVGKPSPTVVTWDPSPECSPLRRRPGLGRKPCDLGEHGRSRTGRVPRGRLSGQPHARLRGRRDPRAGRGVLLPLPRERRSRTPRRARTVKGRARRSAWRALGAAIRSACRCQDCVDFVMNPA